MASPSIGKFQIVSQLGRGGMADVFVCRLQGLGGFDKEVVVKRIIPEHVGDHNFVRMFLDEARIAANLNHSNIVQVFEINEVDGIPYIAMEYVKGVTLGMVISEAHHQKNVHFGHCAKLVAGICAGLDYAHNALDADGEPLGLVHRDVSPGNIAISREGVPKLLDFGVAKANKRLAKTEAGTIKGKLRYMAPEQMLQLPIDHRADIFSVGVCLFELTASQNPFGPKDSDQFAVIRNIVQGTFPRPSEIVPGYPPELEEIVLSAMEQDPEKRCPSARVLHDRLEAFASSGVHASNSRDLVSWLHGLFPNFGALTTSGKLTAFTGMDGTPSGATPSPLPSGSSTMVPRVPAAQSTPAPGTEAPGDGNRLGIASVATRVDTNPSVKLQPGGGRGGLKWAVFGGIALLGAALFLVAQRTPAPEPSATVVATGPAGTTDDEAAKQYLQAADELVKDKRLDAALDMVGKAAELKIKSPDLNIRLARLRDSLATQNLIRRANNQLKGNERRAAIESAKLALDRDADNAEAMNIISAAKSGEEPVGAPPITGKSKERARDGTIAIATNVPALVYVDDDPIGRAPISHHAISIGRHVVQARAHGYRPAESAVQVAAGKAASLTLTLLADTSSAEARPTARGPDAPPAKGPPTPGVVEQIPALGSEPAKASSVTPPSSAPEPKQESLGTPAPTPPAAARPPVATPPAEAPAVAVAALPSEASANGPVTSATPKSPIPVPTLPRVYVAKDGAQLARVCAAVEQALVSQAGVTPAFARGITAPIRRSVGTNAELYPVAMYYFIVREAGLQHDNQTAAANLASAHGSGVLLKLKNLPAIERAL